MVEIDKAAALCRSSGNSVHLSGNQHTISSSKGSELIDKSPPGVRTGELLSTSFRGKTG